MSDHDIPAVASTLAQHFDGIVKRFQPVPRGREFYRKLVFNLGLVAQLEAYLVTLPGYRDPDAVRPGEEGSPAA